MFQKGLYSIQPLSSFIGETRKYNPQFVEKLILIMAAIKRSCTSIYTLKSPFRDLGHEI